MSEYYLTNHVEAGKLQISGQFEKDRKFQMNLSYEYKTLYQTLNQPASNPQSRIGNTSNAKPNVSNRPTPTMLTMCTCRQIKNTATIWLHVVFALHICAFVAFRLIGWNSSFDVLYLTS